MSNDFGTRSPRFEPAPVRNDFDGLLDELRGLSDSMRMQGNYLEELARHYLQVEPQWADQLESVWLWRDWPERNGRTDTGADLVARTRDGGLVAIQVKFFAAAHRVQKSDLDSFFELLGREPFTEGLVIDTTAAPWSSNAIEALKNRSKPVRTVSLDQLRHTAIDWKSYTLKKPEFAPQRHELKQLRAHQHEAVARVMDAFSNDAIDRGQLVMACGTGKTFTALKLAERWTRERADSRSTVLFMVPSLALLQQTLEEWTREHDPELPLRVFAVGSDQQLGRVKNGDLTSVRMDELGAPATTNGAELARVIELAGEWEDGMTVVFSTYHSVQAIHEAQQHGLNAFDLIICDEAHRTTGVTLSGDDESHFVLIHDNDYVVGDRRVYMTATPRIFNPNVKHAARERDAELVSMDDEQLFGRLLYRISFSDAVEQQLLTDYKVLVLGVSEDQIVSSFQQDLASDGHELQISEVAKLIGCWNGMAKRQAGAFAEGFGEDRAPMTRAVAFARDIKTSKGIANDFPHLVNTHLSDVLNDDTTDDLAVRCRHVDGTMGATERGELLDWLKAAPGRNEFGQPEARILTNARCLSEGIDVPSLDAVLFLNARKSQVDVVQAVGRVMRRAAGKRCGYIILPIAVPEGVSTEAALNDNERYQVVWQVLQALRSHDERLDAAINQMAITGKAPETILVERVDLTKKNRESDLGIGDRDYTPEAIDDSSLGSSEATVSAPLFGAEDWKDSVYAKLVKNVGDRMYWDDWAGDISEIAQRYIALVHAHLNEPSNDRSAFEAFHAALKSTVNPEIEAAEAIELLAQHLVTMPIFAAMFPDDDFTHANPISQALQAVVESLAENAAFAREREPLEGFYAKVTDRIRKLPDFTSKQKLLVTLYDRFFAKAFPKLASRMGIVFTPVEVVDYILRSADEVLQTAFGRSLGDPGVKILDPFTGTGTFITRLMQLDIIPSEHLEHKYQHDLFANEIVLLSYYIAAVNIESVFREVSATTPDHTTFAGISLTDTFAMDERDSQLAGGVFPENTERLERERSSEIDVIVMNPPYSVGQKSSNDDNQNAHYALDDRIRDTYATHSTATNKNGLYDSYYRALRWATDRIGERGVIAFVSNSAFIDGSTADGVRLTWDSEFSEAFIYNLRGNQRTQGELSRREGGKVFGSGSRTGVAIAILVKDTKDDASLTVHYADIGDYHSREDKLATLLREKSVSGTDFEIIRQNGSGDWINQRDTRFGTFQAIGDPSARGKNDSEAIFALYSRGLATGRDAWCNNFGREHLERNMDKAVANANSLADGSAEFDSNDPTKINWTVSLRRDVAHQTVKPRSPRGTRKTLYRPFSKGWVYFDRAWNDRVYQLPKFFPSETHTNLAILVNSDSRREAVPLITSLLPDLSVIGTTQVFARWRWEPVVEDDGGFNLSVLSDTETQSDDLIIDGYRRIDNITDFTLERYREAYEDLDVTKDDIFFGIYALLHHPEYRERYAADLKKLLPRIPLVKNFGTYARIGKELADLHLHYESVQPFPLHEKWSLDVPDEAEARFRIEKLSWTKRGERTAIRVNDYLTITGIPEAAEEYRVGGRSPLEWVIERYRVRTDKASGIINDPNEWLTEQGQPRYVVDLIGSLVTVSLATQELLAQLPKFEVVE